MSTKIDALDWVEVFPGRFERWYFVAITGEAGYAIAYVDRGGDDEPIAHVADRGAFYGDEIVAWAGPLPEPDGPFGRPKK